MRFEHPLAVNPEGCPPIDRAQAWKGLLWRVYRPEHFFPALELGRIHALSPYEVRRELELGSVCIEDHIRLIPLSQLHFQSRIRGESALYALMIRLEGEGVDLSVRFEYDTHLGVSPGEKGHDEAAALIQQAYLQCDRDTLALMRLPSFLPLSV
jgi:hypothetical protein